MLNKLDDKWTRGEFLHFKDEGLVSPGSITHKFSVTSRHNASLVGYVKWFAQWRKYIFFPLNAMFDDKCLREIAEFLVQITEEHKRK